MSKQTRAAIWVFCVCLVFSTLSGVAAYRFLPEWFSGQQPEPKLDQSPPPPVSAVKVGGISVAVEDMTFAPKTPAAQAAVLPKFASLEELMGYLKQKGMLYDGGSRWAIATNGGTILREDDSLESMPAPAAPAADGANTADMGGVAVDMDSAGGGASHSEVNAQVDGVAEGDIAITDGLYIYAYASMTNSIVIVRADGANLRQVAGIPLVRSNEYGGGWLSEMYITGDYLVTVSGHYEQLDGARPELLDGGIAACIWYPSRQFTQYAVYDVSDRANPVQTRVFEIEGNPLSTRMIGTDLYFVSSRYIYAVPLDDMGEGDILPLYRDTAEKEAYQVVAPEEIYYFPDSQESNYLLVGAFDVTGNEPARIDSYLGAGSTIYMNLNSLYVARMNWSEGKNQTHFYRFTVERSSEDAPPAVHYAAEGAVPGYLLNQYSMDEYNGVFRAALTDWNVGNYIYTFDTADMQGLGRTEPLAHDEQIRSARFMGDMAYMVTFRQTDPLFTIDLSDPRNPVVLGELKIPGFSSYLHPLGDGLMIGFGRNVLETYVDLPGGGREVVGTIDMGAKISLFDLSDPANPLEIDVLNLERNTWSSDFDNPRAIMVDRERQIFGFSVADYGSINPADVFTGRLIGVQDRRLVDLATLKDADSRKDGGDKDDYYHYYKGERRLRYIGGTLYHISGADVTAFDYTTFERLGTLAFSE